MMMFALMAVAAVQDPVPLDAAAVAATRQVFDRELIDYTSARFRDVSAFSTTNPRGGVNVSFCGAVNSKNRMGAYSGWTRFAFSGVWDVETRAWNGAPQLIWEPREPARSESEIVDRVVNQVAVDRCANRLGGPLQADLSYSE